MSKAIPFMNAIVQNIFNVWKFHTQSRILLFDLWLYTNFQGARIWTNKLPKKSSSLETQEHLLTNLSHFGSLPGQIMSIKNICWLHCVLGKIKVSWKFTEVKKTLILYWVKIKVFSQKHMIKICNRLKE